MAKEIRERHLGEGTHFYSADIMDDPMLFVRLEVAKDCEAELAMLLMSAARRGVIRLDRILPFLTPDAPSVPP